MEEKFDWLDSGNYAEFPKDFDGPVYVTPEWVRHPEKMPPEKLERFKRIAEEKKLWSLYGPLF